MIIQSLGLDIKPQYLLRIKSWHCISVQIHTLFDQIVLDLFQNFVNLRRMEEFMEGKFLNSCLCLVNI